MKSLQEVEQSNDDQFHAFTAMLLNSYKEMRGKTSKQGMQKLIGDRDRLTNEMICFLNNGGMTNDGHVFDLTQPIFIPSKNSETKYRATHFNPQGEFVWKPECLGLPIAGKNFKDLTRGIDLEEYIDLNKLRDTTYLFDQHKVFLNDCIIDHLIFDFRHLIPEAWDFPIISIGTGYTTPNYPDEFWYKMIIPDDYQGKWTWKFVHEKLYINRTTRSGVRDFKFSEARILML